ncbi:MAG: hypothetical protein LC740_05485 [Actinobacteria bacterium]|nr:hypothetical protein [Actinomycetota bacterium]
MSSTNLLRLGGLATVLGAVLLVISGLLQLVLNLFFASPGAVSEVALTASSIQLELALLGQPLVALGLVGLYVRQSEDTGIFGLIGFLVTFLGLITVSALGVEGVEGVAPLANLGWALFGVASLRARVYPRLAAILLIVGATISGMFSILVVALVAGPGSPLVYVGVGAGIILNMVIAWLGYDLSSKMGASAEQPLGVS